MHCSRKMWVSIRMLWQSCAALGKRRSIDGIQRFSEFSKDFSKECFISNKNAKKIMQGMYLRHHLPGKTLLCFVQVNSFHSDSHLRVESSVGTKRFRY